jgi:L-serine deaminase
MARQYFNAQSNDSIIAQSSTGSITTITNIFAQEVAERAFPVPYGIGSSPYAGQIFKFAFGGICTTGTAGTMVITPWFGGGGTGTGVNLGASAAQNYTVSQTNIPFIVEGYLGFRTISMTATTSTAWCTGLWTSVGAIATAGSAWVQTFGSTAAISVDTSGLATAHTFGALNFSITFSVAGTVSAQWTCMQSLN